MLSCQHCRERRFDTKEALQQHVRDSPGHPYCSDCDRFFADYQGYLSHCDTKHPFLHRCCDKKFRTLNALAQHYYVSDQHPNCDICQKGFKSVQVRDKHLRERHSRRSCTSCREMVSIDSLEEHYRTSPKHPLCAYCTFPKGFENEAEYEKHRNSYHSWITAEPMYYHDELSGNAVVQSVPPTQATHARGAREARADVPRVRIHEDRSSTDGSPPEVASAIPHVALRTALPVSPPASPPLLSVHTSDQTAASSAYFTPVSATDQVTAAPTVQISAPSPEDVMQTFKAAATYELLPPRRSPVIESPELERLPSIRPIDSPTSSCPPHSASSFLPPWDYYKLMRHNLSASLPTPLDEEAEDAIHDARSGDPQTIALPASPPYSLDDLADDATAPLHHEEEEDLSLLHEPPPRDYAATATDIESSTLLSFNALLEKFTNGAQGLSELQAETFPHVPTPPPSKHLPPTRPLKPLLAIRQQLQRADSPLPSSALSTKMDVPSRKYSQLLRSPAESLQNLPTADSPIVEALVEHVVRENGLAGPQSAVLDAPSPPSSTREPEPQVGSSKLHCRLCLVDPCKEPTATFCGHIFCNSCITESIVSASKCPVCNVPTLLYCLFKLDLAA
ncbi:hypothetical protein PUNSTDRAFT_134096 [Punctularia strigosozonata HHB-11173 SS5]|uniref:uncharacterized protein n=1 Tax=Punctularia strigosozonata (strain HHB-11173) TaxID=741275 RepID=UPI0004418101|nr:uncharacterized protein PUNSTDRAFT_134096 [Punctularia strigosozonata HHB-11173 SS5]EIN08922.1 hypothetical protein PUNSTDRAFT_134096 [Punctularia strigosozonata HHB-11173 SS5]